MTSWLFVTGLCLMWTFCLGQGEFCSYENCHPPNCRCKADDIPGGFDPSNTPQMIMLTFDDAVNEANYYNFRKLLDDKYNPGGCPVLSTFYVSHEYTDYQMVQELYAAGHEIASHSISHRQPAAWWEWATYDDWKAEIEGQRQMIAEWANIPKWQIRGMRAPYLQVGGNAQFQMISDLREDNFLYDSSLLSYRHRQWPYPPPSWPYTMDYPPGDECGIEPCPWWTLPGVWEIPIVDYEGLNGEACSMADDCTWSYSEDEVYLYLEKNFNRHYYSNRAPFGIYLHGQWLENWSNFNALNRFISDITQKGDVYFATAWQVINWMMYPTLLSDIGNFFCPIRENAWACDQNAMNVCEYDINGYLTGSKRRRRDTTSANDTVTSGPVGQSLSRDHGSKLYRERLRHYEHAHHKHNSTVSLKNLLRQSLHKRDHIRKDVKKSRSKRQSYTEHRLHSCKSDCPPTYPWLYNIDGYQ